MTELIIKPRIAPRDAADALITAGVGLLQVFLLIGLPGIAAYAFSGKPALALLTMLIVNSGFVLLSVNKLALSADGIRFVRVLGGPKFLPWSQIGAVELVSRKDLIVHGWLWPLIPPRELTTSLTSVGHCRIVFGNKAVYFPPEDAAAFLAAVSERMAVHTSASANKEAD